MAEVTVRGARFHYQLLGDHSGHGPCAVFVHGLVMDNLSSWYFTVANAVATHAPVVLYDLRGHGKSESTATGYTAGDMTLDLVELLAAVAPNRQCILIANSFGGLIALAVALRAKHLLCGMVLVDAHLGDAGFGEQMSATLSLQGEARDRQIAESFSNWLGRNSERKRSRLAERAKLLVEETSLIRDMRNTSPIDPSELSQIDVPTLALYGEKSDILERCKVVLQNLPNCEFRILNGCTHSILWEATDTVRDEIVAFVKKVAPS